VKRKKRHHLRKGQRFDYGGQRLTLPQVALEITCCERSLAAFIKMKLKRGSDPQGAMNQAIMIRRGGNYIADFIEAETASIKDAPKTIAGWAVI